MSLVKGIAFLNIRSFVLERYGAPEWDAFCEMFSASDQATLNRVEPSGWYPLGLLATARRALDARFGRGDLALVETLGRFEAQKDLSTVMRWFFRVIPPDFVVQRIDLYWRRFHDSGRWTSEVKARNITARLHDWGVVDEALCRNLTGYLRGTLELIPNRDFRVDHPRCRARGHSSCEFVWRWQPEDAEAPRRQLTVRDVNEIGRELVQITDQEMLGRAIAEVLVHQFACTSVGLWKLPKGGGEGKLLYTTSSPGTEEEGGAKRCFVLEIRGRALGRLEVGMPAGASLPDLFEDLLLWFAMALDATHDPAEELEHRIASAATRWGLTPRQTEVTGQLARGLCNKDIARNLSLQDGTVEIHVSQILRKAGVESRATLIAAIWSASGL